MPKNEPLTASEEMLWRALMRIVVVLPRLLDRDMLRTTGLTPAHLASVRRRMFDHLDAPATKRTAQVLSQVAAQMDDKHPDKAR